MCSVLFVFQMELFLSDTSEDIWCIHMILLFDVELEVNTVYIWKC